MVCPKSLFFHVHAVYFLGSEDLFVFDHEILYETRLLLVPPMKMTRLQFLGAFGLISGGTAGVIRGTTPVIFALVSGSQWFGLGTVFWCTYDPAESAVFAHVSHSGEKQFSALRV